MKTIKSQEKLNEYLNKYNILSLFDTPNLEFFLFEYKKGETIVNSINPLNYFLFLVSGSIRIYSILDNGMIYSIHKQNDFCALGDMEFAGYTISQNYVEALSDVYCIGISFHKYKNLLQNDNSFLRFIIKSLADKMNHSSTDNKYSASLEDRIFEYFKLNYTDKVIEHMGDIALTFNISTRQIQRILKRLVEKELLVRLGKGKYRLIDDKKSG
jgi:CRP-like cAMP-binding protein